MWIELGLDDAAVRLTPPRLLVSDRYAVIWTGYGQTSHPVVQDPVRSSIFQFQITNCRDLLCRAPMLIGETSYARFARQRHQDFAMYQYVDSFWLRFLRTTVDRCSEKRLVPASE